MTMAGSKRNVQFRLRTLLLIVSVTAIALGTVGWLGAGVLPFEAAAVGVCFSARTKACHLLEARSCGCGDICIGGPPIRTEREQYDRNQK
jgi:hypothetical protein